MGDSFVGGHTVTEAGANPADFSGSWKDLRGDSSARDLRGDSSAMYTFVQDGHLVKEEEEAYSSSQPESGLVTGIELKMYGMRGELHHGSIFWEDGVVWKRVAPAKQRA